MASDVQSGLHDADGSAEERIDWIEVRLLGPLRVRRADGHRVQDRDWRTGKNADLLRWLALEAGNPVPVDALIEGLWPEVDEARARASLRTAASQLRRVLGSDVVGRTSTGVVLNGAWVDAPTFVELAEDVGRRRREGNLPDAFTMAREADALYLADVVVGDNAPPAIGRHAAALAAAHRALLGDAAEIAVELGWMRDAVDFASRLLEKDPVSERASRALMLGYSGMGEAHHALREYERCRHVLAEELGVDPSPQTRAVHLQVLNPSPPTLPTPPLVGRGSEVVWLETVLREAMDSTRARRPRVVLLAGAEGSGRRRLAGAVCDRLGLPIADISNSHDLTRGGLEGRVAVWEPNPSTDLAALSAALQDGTGLDDAVVLILLLPPFGDHAVWERVHPGDNTRCLEMDPLLPEDVERVASQLLGGAPSATLVDELLAVSDGLPGRVAETIAQWASTGRLVATSNGLALAPTIDSADDDVSIRRRLARALPRLEGDSFETLLLAAVLDQPVTPAVLAPLLTATNGTSAPRVRATSAIDQLVDLALLRTSAAGAEWRHPLLADAVRTWMRPAVRRRLHRRVAERAPVTSAMRVRHWLQAGERELACVAALDAAEEAASRGDHAGARSHLLEVCSLGQLPDADTGDRVSLFERLGDACALLRRPDEACEAYREALDVSRANMLPDTARLRRKLQSVSDPRALELAATHRAPEWSSALAGLGFSSMSPPDDALESALLDAVEQADRSHDPRVSVQARLQLASGVYLLRREFRTAHEWVEAALARGPRPVERLHAAVIRGMPFVLLGGGRTVREPLRQAMTAAEDAGEDDVWWRLLGMRMVVAHDLGDAEFESLWRTLRDRVLTGPVDERTPELASVAVRVLVEREELDLAESMSHHLPMGGGQHTVVMGHVSRIAMADLAEANGEHRRAAELLRSVLDDGTATRCTLLVPEAAARLVAVEATQDPAASTAAFDVYDDVVGATLGGAREEFWRRMARAAVRAAHGDAESAASACTQASSLASRHGLQVLAVRARRQRAAYLRTNQLNSPSVVPLSRAAQR